MRNRAAVWVVAGILGVGASLAYGQPNQAAPVKGTEVDNTRINKADRDNTRPTPQAQSGAKADRQLAAAVRKAIVRDKSLSTYAHNVKVVTRDGVVTLRGPVRSGAEKAKVSQLAQQIAGVSRVDDELLVKTRSKSKKG